MVQRFHELVAAVRVAGKIGFAHAGNDRLCLNLVGVNRRQG